jgi:hypothetical protein
VKPARATTSSTTTAKPIIRSANNVTARVKDSDMIDIIFNLQKENKMLVNDVMSLKQRIAAAVAFFDDRLKVSTSSLDKKISSKSSYLNSTVSKHAERISSMESDVREMKLVIAEYVRKILHYHVMN